MKKYCKKPIVIEAVQYTQKMYEHLQQMGSFEDENPISVRLENLPDCNFLWNWHTKKLIIPTLEGEMIADVGDYIIRGAKGEYSPCKPDIFAATYEAVLGD